MQGRRNRPIGLCVAFLMTAWGGALAGDVIPQQEYDKYIDKHKTIQSMDSSIFGEQVNLRDGGVMFRVVDGELAGTGPTIRIVRTFRLRETDRLVETSGTSVAGWILEVPRMKTITNYTAGSQGYSAYGWQVPGSDMNARCTNFSDPGPVAPGPGRYWEPFEWWSGYQVVDELGNEQDVIGTSWLYPETMGYKAVTTGNWRFSCLPTLTDGAAGEGFLATAPDGTRYWFNYLVYTDADWMTKPLGAVSSLNGRSGEDRKHGTAKPTGTSTTMSPAYDVLVRRHAMLLATRMEDRFGNWVTYQYSGMVLTRIDASDGRFLEVAGSAPRTISLGSGGAKRTWTYASGPSDTVTQPDGSVWSYNFSALTSANIPSVGSYVTGQCQLRTINTGDTVQGTAASPSGAIGTFTFTLRRFGRSNTPKECKDPDGDGEGFAAFPADWFAYALTQKTLSGPGMSTLTWSYAYSPPNASWDADCAGSCTSEVWTDVTAPDGVRQRSVFSNRFNETENLLLREETYSSANSLKRVILHEYATYLAYSVSSPYPWPQFIGEDLVSRNNKARSERWTPASRRQTEQDGHTVTWQVLSTCGPSGTSACFDNFARPTKVEKRSAPPSP